MPQSSHRLRFLVYAVSGLVKLSTVGYEMLVVKRRQLGHLEAVSADPAPNGFFAEDTHEQNPQLSPKQATGQQIDVEV